MFNSIQFNSFQDYLRAEKTECWPIKEKDGAT